LGEERRGEKEEERNRKGMCLFVDWPRKALICPF
jgi:hypothetical protein